MTQQAELIARTSTRVSAAPDRAFRLFTEAIGTWWRRGTNFWVDPDRGTGMRLEPGLGGRWLEVYDDQRGETLELGRITHWDPPRGFAALWRIPTWPEGEISEIQVSFVPSDGGTEVIVLHDFTRAPSAPTRSRIYREGWKLLLGFFASAVSQEKPAR